MIDDRYVVVDFVDDYKTFEFISEGPNGQFRKTVQYIETATTGLYNLGFGVKNELTNEIDDQIVTNNGDSRKILATVVKTLFVFTDHYPEALVMATGSTLARTRLYRMGITNNLLLIERDFHVYGYKNNNWVKFEKNGPYDVFLVKRKKINIFDI
jgi:hypothetical protein